jgi:hypothetical protein
VNQIEKIREQNRELVSKGIEMAIKRTTDEELIGRFVNRHRGRLLYMTGGWMEWNGTTWVNIPTRKVNRLIRNNGWHAVNATSTRRMMEEHPLSPFVHSGPLPVVATELSVNVEMTPAATAFLERYAGRLIYDHSSKWWMTWTGSGRWEHTFDREVNRLIRELGVREVDKVRRELSQHIGFAVKEMVS